MTRLKKHGTELARAEYRDCRLAIMSDGSVMKNEGFGWRPWKRLKSGVDPAVCAARWRANYDGRPSEYHVYVRTLTVCCDLERRARLDALVGQMPDHPDAVCSLFHPAYSLRLEDFVRCCRARKVLDEVMADKSRRSARTSPLKDRERSTCEGFGMVHHPQTDPPAASLDDLSRLQMGPLVPGHLRLALRIDGVLRYVHDFVCIEGLGEAAATDLEASPESEASKPEPKGQEGR